MRRQQTANLLSLVREHQNKNDSSDIYFSLSTCVNILLGTEPDSVFTLSFGDPTELPEGVIHRHVKSKTAYDFLSFQPFVLDTLLISVKTGAVVDTFGALADISGRVIRASCDPMELMERIPVLSVRAAALMSETGFSISEELELAIRNNAHRIANAPGSHIWREFKRVLRAEKPSIGIEFLRITGILDIILPELVNCYGVEQNQKYHKYTVYKHLLEACDACVRDNVIIRFSALVHDIGKPDTKGFGANGITFHKHEVVGTKMCRKIVQRFDLGKSDAMLLLSLVSNHMYQYDRVWKDSTVRRFIRRVGLTKEYIGRMDEFPLFQLRYADRMGRGLPPNTSKQQDFEDRLTQVLEAM